MQIFQQHLMGWDGGGVDNVPKYFGRILFNTGEDQRHFGMVNIKANFLII